MSQNPYEAPKSDSTLNDSEANLNNTKHPSLRKVLPPAFTMIIGLNVITNSIVAPVILGIDTEPATVAIAVVAALATGYAFSKLQQVYAENDKD